MSFENKKVIVTGATGYIGSCIVKNFIEKKAIVGCVCRDIDKYKHIFSKLKQAILIHADVTNYEELEREILTFVDTYGQIDILINCAGGSARKREKEFVLQEKEVFDEIVSINLMGTMYTTQICLRNMKKGCVVNISSYIGVMGQQYASEYAASKGGVIAFTKALAKECAKYGIRVNCISPGYVPRPEEIVEMGEDDCQGYSFFNGKIEAQDIANAVIFLASDSSKHIIGHNLLVDGGSSLALRKIYEGQETIDVEYMDIDPQKKYIIYATGGEAQKYVDYLIKLKQYDSIVCFTDSDESKWEKTFNEKRIICPRQLIQESKDINIIIASIQFDEIYKIVRLLGIETDRILNYRKK